MKVHTKKSVKNLFSTNNNNYIKRLRIASKFGMVSAFGLLLLALGCLFPFAKGEQITEAATGTATDSSLSVNVSRSAASVDLTPASVSGTFMSSGTDAAFTVTTNNYNGYTLSIIASDTTGHLTDSTTSNYLSSISSAISEATFSATSGTSYNGLWGYKPSRYNSSDNTNYLPAPTSTTTLDITDAANTSGTTYTIAVGARADYTTPAGSYSGTFVVTAVSNPITYTINFDKNTTDTVSNMPSTQGGSTSATSVTLSSSTPTREHYTFTGWCNGTTTTTNGVDACTGTTFAAGASYGIDKTTLNTTTLYAMWKIDTFTQTVQYRYQAADGTYGSYTTVTAVYNYGTTFSWSTSSISGFNSTIYAAASVASYTVSADKTNQVNIDRNTHTLTVTAGSNIGTATGGGTYRVGQTVTVTAADSDADCTTYTTPAWTVSSGATGTLSATSGTSLTYTMGTTDDTLTVSSTATSITTATLTFRMTGGANLAVVASSHPNQESDGTYYYGALTYGPTTVTNGQSITVTCNYTYYYTFSGGFNTGYTFSSWSTTKGTLTTPARNGTQFRATGDATITLTGKSVASGGTMQDYTSSLCAANASNNEVYLTDSRDNQTYTVRYINGVCWMTQNLNFDASKTMYASTSNVNSTTTLSVTDLATLGNSYTAAGQKQSGNNAWGTHYNFCAASAGEICESSNTTESTMSVCPKGWRLPTSSEVSSVLSYMSVFNMVYSGSVFSSAYRYVGYEGWLYTSTPNSATNRYRLLYSSGSAYLYGSYRGRGVTIRCVASS